LESKKHFHFKDFLMNSSKRFDFGKQNALSSVKVVDLNLTSSG
jgi:hypothetical protein